MISDAVLLLLANACFLAAGLGVTRLAGRWRTPDEALRTLSLAYLAGLAAVGTVAPLLLVAGLSLSLAEALALCAALALLGALPWRLPLRAAPPAVERLPLGLLAVAAATLALLAVDLWFQPLWSYDAWTFWTPKARALLELDGLDATWFSSPDVLNRDYPLLLPAVEAIGFRFTGYETRLLDLQSWLVLVAFVAALLELLRPRARGVVVGVVVVLLAVAPAVGLQAAAAQADLPLAVFVAAAALLAWIWIEEEDAGALVLLALLAGAAASTKVEGIAYAAGIGVVVSGLLLVRARRRAAAWTAAACVSALVVAVVPWRVWLASVHVESQASLGRVGESGLFGDRLARIPRSAARLVVELLDPTAWLVVMPLVLVLVVLSLRVRRSDTAALLALGTVLVCLAGLVIAYWTSPFDLEVHLDRSARRVVMAPILAALALVPLLGVVGGRRAGEP